MKAEMTEKQRVTADDESIEFVLANGDVIEAYVNEEGSLTICAARGKVIVLPRADNAVTIATTGFLVDAATKR